ncbi:MAG: hypothetical protein CVT67_10810 [Actinobacteria bacterium HGW-Actinobacteria-7]|jgi:hypothetical protein|nr:MAG: hypothetical protein CVT67_10810 [Actinobacteria bacterium HGW-Actinobacteria-7]
MQFSARMMTRIALVALLATALTMPATAGAQGLLAGGATAASVPSDDDISGAVPLPSSPVAGSLDYAPNDGVNYNDGDVFSVYLEKGQTLTARLMGPAAAQFVLALYSPDATTVNDPDAPVVAETVDMFYPSFLSASDTGDFGFVAPDDGTYFLEVYTYYGTGAYTLDWAVGAKPSVSISPSHYIRYGQSTKFTGSVLSTDGAGLAGQPVELYAWSYLTDDYKKVASTETTTGGAYSFTIKPTGWTFYKTIALVNQPGLSFVQSVEKQIKVRIVLTRPAAPKSVYLNRKFKISGYMNPRHLAGNHTVYVYAYRRLSNGSYKYVKKFRTTNGDSLAHPTYSRYSTSAATLPYRGTWKLIAKALDDGKHAYSYSTTTYLKVR